MKRTFAAVLLSFTSVASQAQVAVDPVLGQAGLFSWTASTIEAINLTSPTALSFKESFWSITAPAGGAALDFTVLDQGVPGDSFALLVNNVPTNWTNSFVNAQGFFQGVSHLVLAPAETITVTVNTLTPKPGQDSGSAFYTFAGTAPVPEPDTYALMLAGLGLLGFAARRRTSRPGERS